MFAELLCCTHAPARPPCAPNARTRSQALPAPPPTPLQPPPAWKPAYFSFWVILSITWGFIATIVGTFLPLWEARESLARIMHNLFTCTVPTSEDEATGKAVPGDFARQMYPAPSFGKLDAEPEAELTETKA